MNDLHQLRQKAVIEIVVKLMGLNSRAMCQMILASGQETISGLNGA